MRANSLALRLFLWAAVTTLAIILVTGIVLSSLYRQAVERLRALPNVTACSVIHPSCQIGSDVRVGVGSCLAPGVIVTTSASIGNHCIVNVKVSISHDSVIEDFVNLNPGVTIAGNVRIGQGAYIGAGARIREGCTIGAGALVGMGSVVLRDVPPGEVWCGQPARRLRAGRPSMASAVAGRGAKR